MIEFRCVDDPYELDAIFDLRRQIFVEEQGVPLQEEIDSFDLCSKHIACFYNGRIIGCARLYIENNVAHLGRVCISKPFRGLGIGTALCDYLCCIAKDLCCNVIELNSQVQAMSFYKKMGYKTTGEIFMDAGISHIKMNKSIK